MKKGWILLFFALIGYTVSAQQQTTYNKKGDEALQREDYSDAKMWYEEGVINCNLYSIEKITNMWIEQPDMRVSLRLLANKCFNCLTEKSAENDTVAIRNLIHYHQQGIGVPKNKTLAAYWIQRLGYLTKDTNLYDLYERPAATKQRQYDFFIGYNYSIETPFGLTVGAIGKKMGWYVRVKSNFSFANYDGENNNEGLTPQITDQYLFDKKKISSHAGSAGVILKLSDKIHASVGAGYGLRDVLWHHVIYNEGVAAGNGWTKNSQDSHSGLLAEADLIWSFGNWYLSAGCYTVNFNYADLNAGIGVYF